ncbi:MAG: hypothetical protein LAO76_15300 [Acidobacteriia bacterium]|nr:hypothetical protein [Terriglobia bacterium]
MSGRPGSLVLARWVEKSSPAQKNPVGCVVQAICFSDHRITRSRRSLDLYTALIRVDPR